MPSTDPLPIEVPIVIGLIVASFMTGITSYTWGRNYGDVSCRYVFPFSPSGQAFGIWGVLWALTAVSTTLQFVVYANGGDVFAAPEATALLAGAWTCAAAWPIFFSKTDESGYVRAAVLLVLSALLAFSAAVYESLWSPRDSTGALIRLVFVNPAYSLLPGWVSLAATINVYIAVASRQRPRKAQCLPDEYPRDYSIIDQFSDDYVASSPVAVPLLLSIPFGITAVLVRDVLLPASLVWGIGWMRPNALNNVAVLFLSVCCVVVYFRG